MVGEDAADEVTGVEGLGVRGHDLQRGVRGRSVPVRPEPLEQRGHDAVRTVALADEEPPAGWAVVGDVAAGERLEEDRRPPVVRVDDRVA